MEKPAQSFDVCIVCALPEEARAFLEILQQQCGCAPQQQVSSRYQSSYHSAILKNDKDESLSLHISWLPRCGLQGMTLHLSRVLEEYQPLIVIMTGICAGDAQRVHLGDLVVAERTFTYDNGKFGLDERGRRVHLHDATTYQLDANILQFLGLFDAWKPLVASLQRPLSASEQREVVCHLKAMASGNAVRTDRPFEDVQVPVRGTVAIDMEGAAFSLVMSNHPLIRWLVVKGVCDYADQMKSDDYHDYAARASALYALSFIRAYVTHERFPRPNGNQSSRAGPPSVWNVPYPRNPHFTGHDELLNWLCKQLLPEAQDASTLERRLAISGLAGVGKTHTAVEYAYCFAQYYEAVLWLQADSWEILTSECMKLAPELGLTEQETAEKMVAEVKRWLQRHDNWLLILDNVESPQEILPKFVPTRHHGSVLVTTRVDDVEPLAPTRLLSTMTEQEGVLFLLRRTGTIPAQAKLEQANATQYEEARQIWQLMDGLPLALDQAGAYIREMPCSFLKYQEQYAHRRVVLLQRRGKRFVGHEMSVATTFSLAFERVEESNLMAADILRACSMLHGEAIAEEIFLEGAVHLGERFATNPGGWDEAVGVLRDYSLVQCNTEKRTLTMHRLVQAMLFDAMTEQERDQWTQQIIQALTTVFPDSDPDTWKQCDRLLLHALSCLERANPTPKSLELASLATKSAKHLCSRARYAEAEPLYRRALHIREQMCGPEHIDVAQSQHNLANLYVKQGKYAEAESYYQRAIQIEEAIFEPKHPYIALSLHCLANLYAEQGKYTEAKALYQRTIQIYQQTPKWMYSYEVVDTLSDLATLFQELGEYEEAETLYLQMLQVLDMVTEPPNPGMATLLNNVAVLYKVQGKYAEAERLYQQALHIREQILGETHPDVAQSLHNLANLRVELSQYTEAEPLYLRALQTRRLALEPDHPDIAQNLLCLAILYHKQGKHRLAEPLYLYVLQTYEKKLGQFHPATASCIGALANLYGIQGEYDKAGPLYQWALQIHTQALGQGHPSVAQALNNLANLYADWGKCAEAKLLYQQALQIREQKLGPLHPDVAETLNNLATLFCQEGKPVEAEPLYLRALQIREQGLGPEHPGTASSLNNLASLYVEQGRYGEAEPLYRRALQIREQVLGPEHIDTANTFHDFAKLWQALGNYEDARTFYERALTILSRSLGSAHPYTIGTRLRLRAVLVTIGKTEEVALLDAAQPELEENRMAVNQEEGQYRQKPQSSANESHK